MTAAGCSGGRGSAPAFNHFNGIDGLLLTIGGMTLVKCRPNLETPAQNQTVKISSLPAMIMSTNGSVAKKIKAGRYCSPRAARKMVLSRKPISTSSTMGAMSSAGFTKPEVLAGSTGDSDSLCTPESSSGTTRLISNATYSAMSNQVLRLPAVNGTRRHGRNRIVLSLAQNR